MDDTQMAVAVLGFLGAIIGLVTAIVGRHKTVTHRFETSPSGPSTGARIKKACAFLLLIFLIGVVFGPQPPEKVLWIAAACVLGFFYQLGAVIYTFVSWVWRLIKGLATNH